MELRNIVLSSPSIKAEITMEIKYFELNYNKNISELVEYHSGST